MQSLGPIIGMLILGALSGWVVGRLCCKVLRWALIAIAVVIALELIGFSIATAHWDSIVAGAETVTDTTLNGGSTLWKLATYNLPFTLAFLVALWYGVMGGRKR